MASMEIGIYFCADFDLNFAIFAFRNAFSALFPLVNGKLGPFAPKICHNNDMYEGRSKITLTFAVTSTSVVQF